MGVSWGKVRLIKVLSGVFIDCCWSIGSLLLNCWKVSWEIEGHRATHLGLLKEEEKSTPGKPFSAKPVVYL